jgi:hypothetical protein
VTFHFCPVCGSTVYWEAQGFRSFLVVAIGTFTDTTVPPPSIAVWKEARHPWVELPRRHGAEACGQAGMKRVVP